MIFANDFHFTPEEKAFIASEKTIKISNQLDWYPYDYNENGIPKGFAVDYIKFISQLSGLKVVFVSDTWKNILEKFNKNEIDIVSLAGKTPKRENDFFFSQRYLVMMKYALIVKQQDSNLTSFNLLKNKKLALVKGWSSANYIKNYYKDLNIIEFNTSLEALEAVAFGVADATVEDENTAQILINNNLLSNLHVNKQIDFDFSQNPLFLMFSKKNALLVSIFDKVMGQMSKDDLAMLQTKWMEGLGVKHNSESIHFTTQEREYLNNLTFAR